MSQTIAELAGIFINQLKDLDPRLNNLPAGSTFDALGGATGAAVNEAQVENELMYQNHYIQTAKDAKLDQLATDQYSSDFARPQPIAANGFVTFLLNAETNPVPIDVGVVVKTQATSDGTIIRYTVTEAGTLVPTTTTSISLPVECTQVGSIGNVAAGAINQIETSLVSSLVTCLNEAAISNGEDSLTDGEYRDYIYELLATFRKYVQKIIEDAALAVLGPNGFAQATEEYMTVKQWVSGAPVGDVFQIARAFLYCGYLSGSITTDVINKIQAAIKKVRALGVYVNVIGVEGVPLDFQIRVVLKPSGPNYNDFVLGKYDVVNQLMKDNVLALPIVNDLNPSVTFVVEDQKSAIESAFSDDFYSVAVVQPVSNVTITTSGEKFIPNAYGVLPS